MSQNASAPNLLNFDWSAEVSDEDRDKLIGQVVGIVRKWRLEVPATLFFETMAPLSFFGGQGAVLFSPFLAPLFPGGLRDVQRISKLMDSPDNMRLLIDRIAEDEADAARK